MTNSPIKTLTDEHEIIKSAAEIVKNADKLLAKDAAAYEKLIRKMIIFFRVFADQFHHHKEEEILFPEMAKKNEILEDGVIKEMLENHEDFRERISNIESSLDKKEYPQAQQELIDYTEALLDHIALEDDEVFQMADSLFTEDELEKMYFRFQDSDYEIGEQNKAEGKLNKTELAKQLSEMQGLLKAV